MDRLTCQGDDILNRTLRGWDVRNDDERGHVLEIFYIPEINHLDNLRNFCSAPGANAILKEEVGEKKVVVFLAQIWPEAIIFGGFGISFAEWAHKSRRLCLLRT